MTTEALIPPHLDAAQDAALYSVLSDIKVPSDLVLDVDPDNIAMVMKEIEQGKEEKDTPRIEKWAPVLYTMMVAKHYASATAAQLDIRALELAKYKPGDLSDEALIIIESKYIQSILPVKRCQISFTPSFDASVADGFEGLRSAMWAFGVYAFDGAPSYDTLTDMIKELETIPVAMWYTLLEQYTPEIKKAHEQKTVTDKPKMAQVLALSHAIYSSRVRYDYTANWYNDLQAYRDRMSTVTDALSLHYYNSDALRNDITRTRHYALLVTELHTIKLMITLIDPPPPSK